jgi:nitrite reductase/ring-hydroxylating ferredoxin subunit
MILCRVHGAMFDKQSGYCVAGPCAGRALIGLPVRTEQGYVLLSDDVDPEALAARYA